MNALCKDMNFIKTPVKDPVNKIKTENFTPSKDGDFIGTPKKNRVNKIENENLTSSRKSPVSENNFELVDRDDDNYKEKQKNTYKVDKYKDNYNGIEVKLFRPLTFKQTDKYKDLFDCKDIQSVNEKEIQKNKLYTQKKMMDSLKSDSIYLNLKKEGNKLVFKSRCFGDEIEREKPKFSDKETVRNHCAPKSKFDKIINEFSDENILKIIEGLVGNEAEFFKEAKNELERQLNILFVTYGETEIKKGLIQSFDEYITPNDKANKIDLYKYIIKYMCVNTPTNFIRSWYNQVLDPNTFKIKNYNTSEFDYTVKDNKFNMHDVSNSEYLEKKSAAWWIFNTLTDSDKRADALINAIKFNETDKWKQWSLPPYNHSYNKINKNFIVIHAETVANFFKEGDYNSKKSQLMAWLCFFDSHFQDEEYKTLYYSIENTSIDEFLFKLKSKVESIDEDDKFFKKICQPSNNQYFSVRISDEMHDKLVKENIIKDEPLISKSQLNILKTYFLHYDKSGLSTNQELLFNEACSKIHECNDEIKVGQQQDVIQALDDWFDFMRYKSSLISLEHVKNVINNLGVGDNTIIESLNVIKNKYNVLSYQEIEDVVKDSLKIRSHTFRKNVLQLECKYDVEKIDEIMKNICLNSYNYTKVCKDLRADYDTIYSAMYQTRDENSLLFTKYITERKTSFIKEWLQNDEIKTKLVEGIIEK